MHVACVGGCLVVNAVMARASLPGPSLCGCVRRCPTLPHPRECSTIGAVGLSFRVRNGTGRFPHAMTAVTLSNTPPWWGLVCKGHWIVSVTRNTDPWFPVGVVVLLYSVMSGSLGTNWWVCCLGTAWWTRSTVSFTPHPYGVWCVVRLSAY